MARTTGRTEQPGLLDHMRSEFPCVPFGVPYRSGDRRGKLAGERRHIGRPSMITRWTRATTCFMVMAVWRNGHSCDRQISKSRSRSSIRPLRRSPALVRVIRADPNGPAIDFILTGRGAPEDAPSDRACIPIWHCRRSPAPSDRSRRVSLWHGSPGRPRTGRFARRPRRDSLIRSTRYRCAPAAQRPLIASRSLTIRKKSSSSVGSTDRVTLTDDESRVAYRLSGMLQYSHRFCCGSAIAAAATAPGIAAISAWASSRWQARSNSAAVPHWRRTQSMNEVFQPRCRSIRVNRSKSLIDSRC